MKQAGSCCSIALVEVTWILVEKCWQYRAADHDVGDPICGDSAKPLAIALRALLVVRGITCLVEAGNQTYAENGDRINSDLSARLNLSFAVIGSGCGS